MKVLNDILQKTAVKGPESLMCPSDNFSATPQRDELIPALVELSDCDVFLQTQTQRLYLLYFTTE